MMNDDNTNTSDKVSKTVVPNSGDTHHCVTCPICYQDFTYNDDSTFDIIQQQQQQQQRQQENGNVGDKKLPTVLVTEDSSNCYNRSCTMEHPQTQEEQTVHVPCRNNNTNVFPNEQYNTNRNKTDDKSIMVASNVSSSPLVFNPICKHKFCLSCIQSVLLSGTTSGTSGDDLCTTTLGNCPVCRCIVSYFDLRYCSNPSVHVANNNKDNDTSKNFPSNLIYSIRSGSSRYYDDDMDDDDNGLDDGIGYCSIHFPSGSTRYNKINNEKVDSQQYTDPYLDITKFNQKSHESSLRCYSFIIPYIVPVSTTAPLPDTIAFQNVNYNPPTKTFQGDIKTTTVLIRFILSFSDNWNCIARGIIVFTKLPNSEENPADKQKYYTILDKSRVLKVERLGTSSGIIYRRRWEKVAAATVTINNDEIKPINQKDSTDDVSSGSALKKLKNNDPNDIIKEQEPSSTILSSTTQQPSTETNEASKIVVGNQPNYYNKKTLWGNVFCQGLRVGLASYHFVSETESYISYETSDASLSWPPLDNGYPIPSRVYFKNVRYDSVEHKFYGTIQWYKDYGTTWQGFAEWDYTMQFDSQYITIVSGIVKSIIYDDDDDTSKISKEMSRYGTSLIYCNASLYTMFSDLVKPKSKPISQQPATTSDDDNNDRQQVQQPLDGYEECNTEENLNSSSSGNDDNNNTVRDPSRNGRSSSSGLLSTMSNLLNFSRNRSNININQNDNEDDSNNEQQDSQRIEEQRRQEKLYDVVREKLLVDGVSFRNMALIDYFWQIFQSKPIALSSNPIKWNFT